MVASATLSLAALECFVHTDPDLEPLDLIAVAIDIGADIPEAVVVADLPSDWRTCPAPPALATRGEQWLRESRTAVLSVPSVVIPHERNFVFNPTHRDFARLTIHPSEPFSFDPRMWKGRGSYADRVSNRYLLNAVREVAGSTPSEIRAAHPRVQKADTAVALYTTS